MFQMVSVGAHRVISTIMSVAKDIVCAFVKMFGSAMASPEPREIDEEGLLRGRDWVSLLTEGVVLSALEHQSPMAIREEGLPSPNQRACVLVFGL